MKAVSEHVAPGPVPPCPDSRGPQCPGDRCGRRVRVSRIAAESRRIKRGSRSAAWLRRGNRPSSGSSSGARNASTPFSPVSNRCAVGERGPKGTLSLERECVRVALVGLRTAERASAVELRYGSRRLAARGSWRQPVASPSVGALASMTSVDGLREYTMRTRHGRLALRARFSLADIEPIFRIDRGCGKTAKCCSPTRAAPRSLRCGIRFHQRSPASSRCSRFSTASRATAVRCARPTIATRW